MKNSSTLHRSVRKVVLLVAALTTFAGAAQAQSKGVVTNIRENAIPVYKSPSDAEPAGTTAAQALPWPIEESRDGFLLVTVGGKRLWVDAMDVTANRPSSNRCTNSVAQIDVAGQPGAGNDRCK